MYSFIRSLKSRQGWAVEAPTGVAAFVIAELFYKFHSFALECLSFLATWYVMAAVVTLVAKPFTQPERAAG